MAKIFILSAASGAGKTTLKDLALKDLDNLCYSISATTRKPRDGEIDGEHYFFKTKDQFKTMITNDELAEYNEVHGNYYGTPIEFIEDTLKSGKNVIMDLDVFGKVNFDKKFPEAIGILILPPNPEELEKRLRFRGTDSDKVINLRLENARKETEFAKSNGKYEFVVVNDDLKQATAQLKEIIINAIKSD